MSTRCTRKPETNEELDDCFNVDSSQVPLEALKTFHRWLKMDADKHAKENNLLTAVRLARMNEIYAKHSRAYCTAPETKGERVNHVIDSESRLKCSMFDQDGSAMKAYCSEAGKHRINSRKTIEPTCTQQALGAAVYTELGTEYCKQNPKELWCSCYNIQTGVCDTDQGSAGCSMAKLDPTLADDAALGREGFDTLASMKECRFNVCQGDVLRARDVQCPETMSICGKSWPTVSTRNNEVIRHCVVDAGGDEEDFEKWGAAPDDTDKILQALKKKENTANIKQMESRVATVGMFVSSCVSCLMVLAAISLR